MPTTRLPFYNHSDEPRDIDPRGRRFDQDRAQLLAITLIPYKAALLALDIVPAFIVGGLTTLLVFRARRTRDWWR